ncbi:MAG TPA: DUF1080 domain-containing protein [Nitrososphaeraceae archaeon]
MITKFVSLIMGGVLAYLLFPLEIMGLQPQLEDISLIPRDNSATNNTAIFDGNTLDGWKMAGNGNFVATEENSFKTGGQGIFVYTKEMYDNFVLRLDWKVSDEDDNSGIFVRFPDLGNDTKIAVKKGYEIQIDDGAGNPLHQTGAIYDYSAPSKLVSKPPGQWNSMEIKVINQSYSVSINGEKINDFTGDRRVRIHRTSIS